MGIIKTAFVEDFILAYIIKLAIRNWPIPLSSPTPKKFCRCYIKTTSSSDLIEAKRVVFL